MLSFIAQPAMGAFDSLSLDGPLPSGPRAKAMQMPRMWAARPAKKIVSARNSNHAVLVDARNVWAWDSLDCHAAATRYDSVSDWIDKHPGCGMSLWVSSPLVQSLSQAPSADDADDADDVTVRGNARQRLIEHHGKGASAWPLAMWRNAIARGVCALSGVDLTDVRRQALRVGVQLHSVEPWWHHAFEQAKRCVATLSSSESGCVCVVEGAQVTWISCVYGLLAEVRQSQLAAPTIQSLHAQLNERHHARGHRAERTVLLGHGLSNGARTATLDAVVLGRLDGDQPPQWLRPYFSNQFH